MTSTGLSPRHEDMLFNNSGISRGVAQERGYRTVESEGKLARLGFGRAQRNVPALLLPVHDPTGRVALHQARPDEPRVQNGKRIKYETSAGSRMALDVHPRSRKEVGDPSVPLFVTEGLKKGDALVSRGVCAIALLGVWNWRGKNNRGGKVALAEWEHVALNGRRVYVVFDSDLMRKPEVEAALSRLEALLKSRGAKVFLVYLPDAEDGRKQGVDDFLVSGHTVEDLIALSKPGPRKPSVTNEQKKPTQSELLIGYAEEAELFHDATGDGYATVEVDGHWETWALRGERFRRYLVRRYYRDTGKAPSSQALAEAKDTIAAMAAFDGPEEGVSVRVAKHGDEVYVDLCNEQWEAAEVTSSGWRVVPSWEIPVRFVRKDNAAELPRPEKGGSLRLLKRFLNVKTEEDFCLVVAWLIGAYNPDGPYPLLVLQGEQGSGKSTAVRVVRSVTDPAVEPLRAPPRDERDLAIAASGNWTLALDNLSGLRPGLSDALCRLSTGGGFATRELYSDDREVIFSQKRPVLLNGIDSLAVAGDLRDRSLVIELPPIAGSGKRTEREFYAELEHARPLLLGAILDATSAAIRNLDRVDLEELPRMADFAAWVTAAEEALPWEPGAFMGAYGGNRSEANERALGDDPVAVAIRRLLADLDEWSGTSTELLAELREHVDEPVTRAKAWPAAPNSLSNKLKRIAPALREAGVEYEERTEGRSKRRVKTLRKAVLTTARVVRNDEEVQENVSSRGRSLESAGDGKCAANDPSRRGALPRRAAGAGGADDHLRSPSEDRVRFSL